MKPVPRLLTLCLLASFFWAPLSAQVSGVDYVITRTQLDAAGHKLRRTVNAGGIIETTDYAGNAVYDGFSLAMLQIPGGYVTLSGTTPTYHYYQKDHLGSNRLVTRATGTVEQIVHYYPSLSPYTYCANSPANIVDPNGKNPAIAAGYAMGPVVGTLVLIGVTVTFFFIKNKEDKRSTENSYSPGWDWDRKRERDSEDEKRRLELAHQESVENSFGDPKKHDENNNFNIRNPKHKVLFPVLATLYLLNECNSDNTASATENNSQDTGNNKQENKNQEDEKKETIKPRLHK